MHLSRPRLVGVRTAKTVLAAVAAYLIARHVSSNPAPVLAPLTALLVVQTTLYESVKTGLRRVLAVVLGVLVAVGVTQVVRLSWWSLGLVVLAGLLVGRGLRLRGELLEVPISAMLVLAVAHASNAAAGRVYETLVGAGVGVLVHGLIAPPLYLRPAGAAVEHVAAQVAAQLRLVGEQVAGDYTVEQAQSWLDGARQLEREVTVADRALARAEDSLRLNPRGRRLDGSSASLRSGLDALERSIVSLRGVSRSLADRARGQSEEQVYGGDVRETLARLLSDLAGAVDAYGRVVGAELSAAQPDDDALRQALHRAWADRAELTERLQGQNRGQSQAWQLHGDLLANVDRLLREVDAEARAQLRDKLRRAAAERASERLPRRLGAAATQPAQRARTATRTAASRRRHGRAPDGRRGSGSPEAPGDDPRG